MRPLGRGPTRGDKFLDGTAITDANPQGEISYCDMAVNLDRAAREGIKAPAADTGKINKGRPVNTGGSTVNGKVATLEGAIRLQAWWEMVE